ncbi:outer membrane beta-barrel protein [Pollutibacter soli]|uniref:outer membrane beta-barrel protein n=1 Tax=Pollutibacter soli TaxID=3034157 RepID=UPI003013B63F
MSKILIAIALIFSFNIVNAQTERGDWMVGGGLELNTSKNKTVFVFNPNIAWFIAKDFALGAQFSYSYLSLGDNRINTYGAGPFIRYYIPTKNVRPFLHGDVDFQTNKIKNNTITTTENAFSFYIAGGAAFFINESLAFESKIGYRYTDLKNQSGAGGVGLSLGFQVYINRRQAEAARSTINGK